MSGVLHAADSGRHAEPKSRIGPEREAFYNRSRLTNVPCEERDRLNRIYHDAVAKIPGSGKTVPEMKSAEWRAATRKARDACKSALGDLKRHRKEHGC